MTPPERELLEGARTATLATIDANGLPRLVPICFVVAPDSAILTPVDEKPKADPDPYRTARVRDILARPDVAVLVDRWSEDWAKLAWLRLSGHAHVVDPGAAGHAEAVSALRAKYPQYQEQRLEARPIIRIEILRERSWPTPLPSGGSGDSAP